MRPPGTDVILSNKRFVIKKWPKWFVAICSSTSGCSLLSVLTVRYGPNIIPALSRSTSIEVILATSSASAKARTLAKSLVSTCTTVALPFLASSLILSARGCALTRLRHAITTCAFARVTKTRAASRPMPELAPVMTTVLPDISGRSFSTVHTIFPELIGERFRNLFSCTATDQWSDSGYFLAYVVVGRDVSVQMQAVATSTSDEIRQQANHYFETSRTVTVQ